MSRTSTDGGRWSIATGAIAALLLSIAACLQPEHTGDVAPLAAGDPNSACASCHADEMSHLRSSRHHAGPSGGLGCLSCHTAHAIAQGGGLGESKLTARCEDCHADVLAQFNLPFRHPLGATVSCTSCHPPHGGARRELQETTRRDACVECHLEMRGPFTYSHEGDHNLGCISCHEPHGSANRRLLTHSETRMLCLSCHENLEIIHIQSPGSVFRNCLACHTEIHGSNWDRELKR